MSARIFANFLQFAQQYARCTGSLFSDTVCDFEVPKSSLYYHVHPFLIHLRFLSVLRLCVLKIVRYAILYPWPFETVFIEIIVTHSVYKLLFFYFSVRRVRVCRVRERLPVNGETNKPLIHVLMYLLNAVSVSVSAT